MPDSNVELGLLASASLQDRIAASRALDMLSREARRATALTFAIEKGMVK